MRHRSETVWREHREELKAYILRRVRSPAEADDILQDVFLKMHRSLGEHTRVGHLRGWLFAIARNAMVDHFRKRRPVVALSEELAENGPEPDRSQQEEIGHCLQPMVRALPAKIRDALVMADLDGMKQQQVAERLGISLAAVKSRILRGRKLVRQLVEDCCHLEFDARGSIMDYVPRAGGRAQCRGASCREGTGADG